MSTEQDRSKAKSIRQQVEGDAYRGARARGLSPAEAREQARGAGFAGTAREFQRLRDERDELLRRLAEAWGTTESDAWLIVRLDLAAEEDEG